MFVKMINNLKGDSDKHREVNSETGCESYQCGLEQQGIWDFWK